MSKKRNEIHVSKQITEMPMLKMNHNARLILYTVLKKIWQIYRNRNDYVKKEILLTDDYEEAKKPVTLNLADLKPLFPYNASYKEIKEHIRKVPKEAEFKTYYDLYGKKRNYLMDTVIVFFTEIQFDDIKREITFTPAHNLLNHIEALKTFTKIDISEMRKLNGNYQVRGYELICQNNYLDKNNNKLVPDETRKIKTEDFRKYFEIPDTYNTGNIDMRVLRPLKRAIDKHTKYNIIAFKKFKLDSNDKKRVSHYRIDVEYKGEYIQELKEKEENNIFDYDNNNPKMIKEQSQSDIIIEDYED